MSKRLKLAILALVLLILLCCIYHTPNVNKAEVKKIPVAKVEKIVLPDLDKDGIADVNDTDIDGDGLLNVDEEKLTSDPFNKDTDGDGKLDGEEFKKDSDEDGVSDVLESNIKDKDNDGVVDELDADDNSVNNDSDKDGYTNIEEKKAGTNPLDANSKPVALDTDKDGKLDKIEKGKDADGDGKGDEVESSKLDADSDGVVDELDAEDNNPNNDTDNDGMSNIDEKSAGTNPLDPNSKVEPDTDKDGKLDKIEKGKDADNDGKSDLIESAKLDADNDGVVDELDADDENVSNDSDGDGFSNIDEKSAGTNPLDPNEHPEAKKQEVTQSNETATSDKNIIENNQTVKVDKEEKIKIESSIKEILKLHKIEFEFNSANLTTKGIEIVDRVGEVLKKYPSVKVEIGGHTDSKGKAKYNLNLSQKRVEKVKAELIKIGIESNRLKAVGYGETKPIAPNDTEENRAKNRRVEFIIIEGGE